jgi:hypothetical protein
MGDAEETSGGTLLAHLGPAAARPSNDSRPLREIRLAGLAPAD